MPTSYYEEEIAEEECEGCRENEIRVLDLEGQISYLDDQLEDKDKFIENVVGSDVYFSGETTITPNLDTLFEVESMRFRNCFYCTN